MSKTVTIDFDIYEESLKEAFKRGASSRPQLIIDLDSVIETVSNKSSSFLDYDIAVIKLNNIKKTLQGAKNG